MRALRVWKKLLGLRRTVIEQVDFDEAGGALVVSVRPRASERGRCPHCRRRCPGYDQGEGRRRWRALDLATTLCFVEADAPRVRCRRQGVVVAAVPWARHDAGFTRSFEDQTALAGGPHLQDRGLGADADRVADGRLDRECQRNRVGMSEAERHVYEEQHQQDRVGGGLL